VNPFGRSRLFPRRYTNQWERESAYRKAYSNLIQGTGGDICNAAFYQYADKIKKAGYGRALWTVHDEIIAQAWPNRMQDAMLLLEETMAGVGKQIELTVPLSVSIKGSLDRWCK